jgi:hypothetical protein
MTTMTTTAMAAMPMLRVVMGASRGLEHGPAERAPGQPDPTGFGNRFAGASVGSEQFAYRGLVGSYLLEIDREARSADKEQPRAQPSHAPLAARPTPHDRLHQLARRDRREQLHAPAGRTT